MKLVVVFYAPLLCLGIFLFCTRILLRHQMDSLLLINFAYILVGTPKPLCITILLLVGPLRRVALVNNTYISTLLRIKRLVVMSNQTNPLRDP